MFGMGGSEIIVILIVALLFLGPDKLPQAAKQISKGIRDLKKQSRSLQQQIEGDEQIGGAIRDLKSALRGDDAPVRPPKPKRPKPPVAAIAATAATTANTAPAADAALAAADAEPAVLDKADAAIEAAAPARADDDDDDDEAAARLVKLPPTAGEADRDAAVDEGGDEDDEDAELAKLVRPAEGTVAKGSEPKHG